MRGSRPRLGCRTPVERKRGGRYHGGVASSWRRRKQQGSTHRHDIHRFPDVIGEKHNVLEQAALNGGIQGALNEAPVICAKLDIDHANGRELRGEPDAEALVSHAVLLKAGPVSRADDRVDANAAHVDHILQFGGIIWSVRLEWSGSWPGREQHCRTRDGKATPPVGRT